MKETPTWKRNFEYLKKAFEFKEFWKNRWTFQKIFCMFAMRPETNSQNQKKNWACLRVGGGKRKEKSLTITIENYEKKKCEWQRIQCGTGSEKGSRGIKEEIERNKGRFQRGWNRNCFQTRNKVHPPK